MQNSGLDTFHQFRFGRPEGGGGGRLVATDNQGLDLFDGSAQAAGAGAIDRGAPDGLPIAFLGGLVVSHK